MLHIKQLVPCGRGCWGAWLKMGVWDVRGNPDGGKTNPEEKERFDGG